MEFPRNFWHFGKKYILYKYLSWDFYFEACFVKVDDNNNVRMKFFRNFRYFEKAMLWATICAEISILKHVRSKLTATVCKWIFWHSEEMAFWAVICPEISIMKLTWAKLITTTCKWSFWYFEEIVFWATICPGISVLKHTLSILTAIVCK